MQEMRALCVHEFEHILSGDFKPEDVDRMVEETAENNFNALQVCVKAPGILYYPSKYGPVHEYCQTYDLLGEITGKAHARGLEVHSYFPIFLDGGWDGKARDVNGGMFAKHPEWRQVHFKDGGLQPVSYPCPSNAEAVDYLRLLTEEQCKNYELDALLLDFIRFAGPCFCQSCREGFKKFSGKELKPGEWVSEEPDYRCERVEAAVKLLAETVRATRPGTKVGAYVFGNLRIALAIVYQDWPGFSKHLDFVLPMYYDECSPEEVAAILPRHRVYADRPMIPGFLTSAGAVQGRGSLEAICSYVQAARTAGCEGFFFFDYENLFGRPMGIYSGERWGKPQPPEVLRRLREGCLREPAEPLFRKPPGNKRGRR